MGRKSKAAKRKEKFLANFRKTKLMESVLAEQEDSLVEQENKIEKLEHRIKRRKRKVEELSLLDLPPVDTTALKRRRRPSCEDLHVKAKIRRRNETITKCHIIHGGSRENMDSTVYGMLDTLAAKCKTDKLACKVLNVRSSLKSAISKRCIDQFKSNYLKSNENLLRSLNVYYSHDVMGKRKYVNVRKANRTPSIPNFVTYKLLSEHMRNIDIGTLRPISLDLTDSLDPDEIGPGYYRDLVEYAPRLAKFYLAVDRYRIDKLKPFPNAVRKDQSSVLFLIAIGGDEAPVAGTTFLMSFLNVGKRIASSAENFLTFGGNVKENGMVVRRYITKLVSQLKVLESEVFEVFVNEVLHKVEFKVAAFPNDMKMLSFLAGELSNAAYYFTTFGNVNKADANDIRKQFSMDGKLEWAPFSYQKCLIDVTKVNKKKIELQSKNVKTATQRCNLTKYIATLKSRQEETPLIGEYVDLAKCEPLHMKNNVCKEMFMKIIKIVMSQNSVPTHVKSFKDLPEQNLFLISINFVRSDMNYNYLAKKIITWFNENRDKQSDSEFSFRFRGKESFHLLKEFPRFIMMIMSHVTETTILNRLVQIFFQLLCLRKLVSYSVRIEDIKEEDIADMKRVGTDLFRCCSIFDARVSPSLWVFYNVAPCHSEMLFRSLNFGLGINTMEGREQKHQMIMKYSENSTYQERWQFIFRH